MSGRATVVGGGLGDGRLGDGGGLAGGAGLGEGIVLGTGWVAGGLVRWGVGRRVVRCVGCGALGVCGRVGAVVATGAFVAAEAGGALPARGVGPHAAASAAMTSATTTGDRRVVTRPIVRAPGRITRNPHRMMERSRRSLRIFIQEAGESRPDRWEMARAPRTRILEVCSFVLVALTLAACTSTANPRTTHHVPSPQPTTGPAPTSAPGTPAPTPPSRVTMAGAKQCPVTLPRGVAPADGTFGNGKLRVGGLWPRGVIAAGPGNVDGRGRVEMKFPWWRMVSGRLEITGHRLDAPAPPLIAHVPTGYGPTGFQASGVTFPTEGCWRVRGTVGRTSLNFVTFVIERGAAVSG